MEQLKLNRETGKYEGYLRLSIDAEIFQRDLFAYAQQNHIDPTNQEEWHRAVTCVSQASKWLNHPHAVIQISQPVAEKPIEPEKPVYRAHNEPKPAPKAARGFTKYPPVTDLRQKALDLPLDEWESLLWPLPDPNASKVEKDSVNQRRYRERQYLAGLRKELEKTTTPLALERMAVVAGAMSANGIH